MEVRFTRAPENASCAGHSTLRNPPPTALSATRVLVRLALADPHLTGFNGTKCDLWGYGIFPAVNLPGIQVQAFHCPPPVTDSSSTYNKLKASFIAGVAVKIDGQTVTAANNKAYSCGTEIPYTNYGDGKSE